MPFVNSVKEAMLDGYLSDPVWSVNTTKHLSLFTAAPSEDGTGGTEVSGGAYARLSVDEAADFGAATSAAGVSTKSNTSLFDFGSASGANWGTITHVGIHDALTLGNLEAFGALTTSRTVNDGESFEIPIGDFDLTAD